MTPEKKRKYAKEWADKNRDKIRAYNKKSREKHREKRNAECLEYAKNHREELRENAKRYRIENPEKIKKYKEAHREENKKHFRKYYHANKEKCADISRAKRARKRSATIYPVKALDVFVRDKWVCGICHNRINKELKYPDPMSASLDHIVPLSKGGSHTYENVQVAHLSCNRKTQTGGTKQLLLPLVSVVG